MGYQSKDASELRGTGWRPDIRCMTLMKSRLIALALTLVLTTACDAAGTDSNRVSLAIGSNPVQS
jgi:hypothetical protein